MCEITFCQEQSKHAMSFGPMQPDQAINLSLKDGRGRPSGLSSALNVSLGPSETQDVAQVVQLLSFDICFLWETSF